MPSLNRLPDADAAWVTCCSDPCVTLAHCMPSGAKRYCPIIGRLRAYRRWEKLQRCAMKLPCMPKANPWQDKQTQQLSLPRRTKGECPIRPLRRVIQQSVIQWNAMGSERGGFVTALSELPARAGLTFGPLPRPTKVYQPTVASVSTPKLSVDTLMAASICPLPGGWAQRGRHKSSALLSFPPNSLFESARITQQTSILVHCPWCGLLPAADYPEERLKQRQPANHFCALNAFTPLFYLLLF